MQRFSVTSKLTVLLALLSALPLFAVGFGKPSREVSEKLVNQRIAICEEIAVGCSFHLRRQDQVAMEKQIAQFAERTADVHSIRLVRFDGYVIKSQGDHAKYWHLKPDEPSDFTNIRVPIFRNNRQWGSLEVAFVEDKWSWGEWTTILSVIGLNLSSFGMLLRKSLPGLNVGAAVPRRVRNTLDTLAGGVVIVDGKNRIVLANETFQKSCKMEGEKLVGKSLDKFKWRISSAKAPWDTAIETRSRCSGETAYLIDASGQERCFVVNATPVFDSSEKLAGALVSFEDVTTLEQQKRSLIQAVAEIEQSRALIHEQNVRLQELAWKDALTGAWNRRSLFEQLESAWSTYQSNGTSLNCAMLDVDHFKKLNDNHGHAVGDQVLKDVSRVITEAVGNAGVVGRYGGEEFCIIMPGMKIEESIAITERVRVAIMVQLLDPYKVTASFGVSSASFGACTFQEMLEQADQALYGAKHGGRNAVKCWSKALCEELEAASNARAEKLRIRSDVDQPISYHAVTSLHAALAYRDADTAMHSQRVAEMSVALARGLVPISELYILEISGLLHDIGKIGVPDSVLLHPGRLNEDQWKIMDAHARMGVEIIEASFTSKSLSEIIRYHHYRYDGSKTPEGGPVGDAIPLGARIVCIVDAFDAMVSDRVYRKGRPVEEAFAELRRCAGTQFDPVLVERFVEMKVGWRADSRFCFSEGLDRSAVRIGHLTERTLNAYDTQDAAAFGEALRHLQIVAEKNDYPAIWLSNWLAAYPNAIRAVGRLPCRFYKT
jgi:diguanylate cyclase (GGDEF)-like protein/PAS domain S-box-containing protein